MVELEQQASETIQKYCVRFSLHCSHAITYPGKKLHQCALQIPTEVIAAFEGSGCNKASITRLKDKKVWEDKGIMTVNGFTSESKL
jgi:hypothetical protein